ncbi:MAG TPA: hypothetical protein VK892_07855 [Pyrinomonadaceae bacterium]|nr:hypothetical protein [Pyrinomonadaceae bacterium]
MIKTAEKPGELKTVSIEKDTWILELPAELCRKEGFVERTLVSLTFKHGGIFTSYIHPSERAKASAKRFINKYDNFMKEMEKIGD